MLWGRSVLIFASFIYISPQRFCFMWSPGMLERLCLFECLDVRLALLLEQQRYHKPCSDTRDSHRAARLVATFTPPLAPSHSSSWLCSRSCYAAHPLLAQFTADILHGPPSRGSLHIEVFCSLHLPSAWTFPFIIHCRFTVTRFASDHSFYSGLSQNTRILLII